MKLQFLGWGTLFMYGQQMRKLKTAAMCVAATVILSGCQSGVTDFGLGSQTKAPTVNASTLPAKTGPAVGDVLGFGPARVALLIPRTAPGNGSAVAKQIQNAAELAISDLGGDVMELVIKDTAGTPAGAITATQAAIREGSAVVLGPLFSSSVTSARSIITQSGRPLVAFSSDPTAAGAGGYLISFLPDQLVSRSVNYAISQGKRSFTAILPSGAYGNLVERQLRSTIQASGGQLLAISKYQYNSKSVQAAITEALGAAQQSDAIFIPDGGNTPAAIIRQLKRLGVDLNNKMVIGTGQWRTANLSAPELQGAVFADMDQARFQAFKQRYAQKFGSEPTVNAALGYDAVLLVGGLLKERPGQQITATEIQRRQGFIGASGIFRFLPSGLNERGLAIFQVQDGVAKAIQAAPSSFSPTQ
jgi:ABC-type branched-subunit amino acid transport system substrate-binding protein